MKCVCGDTMVCCGDTVVCLRCGRTTADSAADVKPDLVKYAHYAEENKRVMADASEYLLQNADGALDYCRQRGIDMQQIKEWHLGYIPVDYPHLADPWEQRVLFPILGDGVPLAFGGRKITVDDRPKYINSSNGVLYNKSRTLYGYHRIGSRAKRVYLCEGYVDTLSLDAKLRADKRDGEFAVASLGTALTAPQAMLLRAKASKITIAYDSDDAGVKATLRAINILHNAGYAYQDMRVLVPVDAKDVDEAIQTGCPLHKRSLARYCIDHGDCDLAADIVCGCIWEDAS